jgi:hypothetical protein
MSTVDVVEDDVEVGAVAHFGTVARLGEDGVRSPAQ